MMTKQDKILNVDSRHLSQHISPESVDFIVFSPPYWNLRDYEYKGQIGFNQSYKEYLNEMKKVFNECLKVLKDGRFMAINIGTVVSNEGMKFISGDFVRDCEEVGFIFRKDIIWHKPRGTTKWQRGATQFSQKPYPLMYNTNINHEFILIFQKGKNGNHDFSNIPRFNRHFIRKMAYSVWDMKPVNSPKLDEKHVAPYPEELPRRLIQLFTFKGDIVLDPFSGCGTTNKVAKELGRYSIAVELYKDYCTLIEDKLSKTKFDIDSEDVYSAGPEIDLKVLKEKLDKAKYDYLKARTEYELEQKKSKQKSGLNKFI